MIKLTTSPPDKLASIDPNPSPSSNVLMVVEVSGADKPKRLANVVGRRFLVAGDSETYWADSKTARNHAPKSAEEQNCGHRLLDARRTLPRGRRVATISERNSSLRRYRSDTWTGSNPKVTPERFWIPQLPCRLRLTPCSGSAVCLGQDESLCCNDVRALHADLARDELRHVI